MSLTLPPHSIEAEQAVLGCCLLAPDDCIADIIEASGGDMTLFYDIRHQTFWNALSDMSEKGIAVDTITVVGHLKTSGKLDDAGGRAYIASLPDYAASAAMIRTYLGPVVDAWQRRRMISACSKSIAECYDSTSADPISGAETAVLAAAEERGGAMEAVSAKEGVKAAIDVFQRLYAANGKPIGIPTGFLDIDRMTLGICETDFWVLAARPGCGKTTLAMNIAEHVAVDLGIPVAVLSLEMPASQLMARMMSARARINQRKPMNQGSFSALAAVSSKIAGAPLWIQDRSMHIGQIKAWCRRMKQRHGVKLFIVDYLQLIPDNGRNKDRQSAVSAISNGLKQIALNLKTPVIALAQLNRDIEKEKARQPRLSDLRESGSIEQDADLVGMLWNKQKVAEDDDGSQPRTVCFSIAKQRSGPVGFIDLTMFPDITRFENHVGSP